MEYSDRREPRGVSADGVTLFPAALRRVIAAVDRRRLLAVVLLVSAVALGLAAMRHSSVSSWAGDTETDYCTPEGNHILFAEWTPSSEDSLRARERMLVARVDFGALPWRIFVADTRRGRPSSIPIWGMRAAFFLFGAVGRRLSALTRQKISA
jgi:hypothetical protein